MEKNPALQSKDLVKKLQKKTGLSRSTIFAHLSSFELKESMYREKGRYYLPHQWKEHIGSSRFDPFWKKLDSIRATNVEIRARRSVRIQESDGKLLFNFQEAVAIPSNYHQLCSLITTLPSVVKQTLNPKIQRYNRFLRRRLDIYGRQERTLDCIDELVDHVSTLLHEYVAPEGYSAHKS